MKEFKAKDLAFYDTSLGLLKVKVISVNEEGEGNRPTSGKVTVKATTDLKGRSGSVIIPKGKILDITAYKCIPRSCVRIRDGKQHINTLYKWVK